MKTKINSSQGVVVYGAGNGIEFEGYAANEHPFGDRWDDLQGTMHGSTGTGQASLTYENYRDTSFPMYFFRHNQDDEINLIFQMTHMWDLTTSVTPHVHIIPMAASDGDVYISYKYVWAPRFASLPSNTSWTSGSATLVVSSSMQYNHHIMPIATISPPTGSYVSQMLLIKFTRSGTNILDTYSGSKDHETAAANVAVLQCDLHYQKIRAGTQDQFGYNL